MDGGEFWNLLVKAFFNPLGVLIARNCTNPNSGGRSPSKVSDVVGTVCGEGEDGNGADAPDAKDGFHVDRGIGQLDDDGVALCDAEATQQVADFMGRVADIVPGQ